MAVAGTPALAVAGTPVAPVAPEADDSLERLALSARDGDATAFAGLFAACAPAVLRYGYARSRNPADAEDLLQQTFLRVVEALPRYEDRGLPFRAWLFRICRSVAIDAHRRRRPHVPLDDAIELVDAGATGRAVGRGRLADVMIAIESLTLEQRQAIELRFFADLSARDAGLVMGRDEAAVRALQARAIATLRRRLGVEQAAAPQPASPSWRERVSS